jgi:TolB-like protein
MAVYGIVGFVLLQIVDLAVPALLLPEWTYRLVALILLLGFPVAIVLAWAFEVTPEGVQKTQVASPGEIDAIVSAPASQRLPSGLLALVGVAALVLGAWWVGTQTAAESDSTTTGSGPADVRLALPDLADDPRPSIAVLPFVNMSADEEQEYFSDGMTEEILNVLAKIKDLKVAARTSTFALRDRELTAMQWGDTLRVAYLVEGSVRKAGDQVRITAQLIDTTDGSHLWTDAYTRPLADIFQVQAEIAEAIADALKVPLGLDEGESLTTPAADLQAYDLYLAGRQQMRARGEGVAEAVKLFEAAIARDSSWAPAWAGLAESRALVPYYAEEVRDSALWANSLTAAERAAERALELDPKNASALAVLGNVYRDGRQWEEAETAYEQALTLDPDNVDAHQEFAEYLYYVGRSGEAHISAHRALALDRAPIRLLVAAWTARLNGFHGEALDFLAEGIRNDPDERIPNLRISQLRTYAEMRDWAALREGLLERLGDVNDTLAQRLVETWPPDSTPAPRTTDLVTDSFPLVGATMWLTLGERERALEILEHYFSDLAGPWFGLLFFPSFDPLREDPRFEALLERGGLGGRRPVRLEADPD